MQSGKALRHNQEPPGRMGANQSSHKIDKTISAISEDIAMDWVSLMVAVGAKSFEPLDSPESPWARCAKCASGSLGLTAELSELGGWTLVKMIIGIDLGFSCLSGASLFELNR